MLNTFTKDQFEKISSFFWACTQDCLSYLQRCNYGWTGAK